jgi:hypothetical protein
MQQCVNIASSYSFPKIHNGGHCLLSIALLSRATKDRRSRFNPAKRSFANEPQQRGRCYSKLLDTTLTKPMSPCN